MEHVNVENEVTLVASGYEWKCPICGANNTEIEAAQMVGCENEDCGEEFEVFNVVHARA